MQDSLKLNINANVDSKGLKNAKNSIDSIGSSAKDSSKHVQSLGDQMGKFAQWQIIGDVIHGVMNATSDMVTQVIKLDDSLVKLQKVTDLTGTSLQNFVSDSYDLGEAVGRTGTEVLNTATEFSKAGYKDQALDLAEVALTYQNVADGAVSTADATALVVSQMKAFKVPAEDAMSIIDQINEVSNNYAVSSSDLATAIPKVSATMAQAGNTMAETTALITAGAEIMTGQSSRIARRS